MHSRPLLSCLALTLGCTSPTTSASDDGSTDTSATSTTDGDGDADTSDTTTETGDGDGDGDPPVWDEDISPEACAADRATPLLDQALASTALTAATFTMTEQDFEESGQYLAGVLGGDFAFSWLWDVRSTPARAGCFDGEVAGVLDGHLASPHPVANMIRHVAGVLDRPVDDAPPYGSGGGFDAAIESLCETTGSACMPTGELPEDLEAALAPIVWAMGEGIEARLAMDGSLGGAPGFWRDDGGNQMFADLGPQPNAADEPTRAYLLGIDTRNRLYRAAAQLAFAIEDVDWSTFAGREGVSFSLQTNAGSIVVQDAADHLYAEEEERLLLVDLGGDDEYLTEIASNASASNPVSIAIDLAGIDRYAYEEVPDANDMPGVLLPADEYGRAPPGPQDGPISISNHFRQGAARNGIAMLFDLGGSGDHYQSLRGSQGYAHHGVGVLFDDGGDDLYLAEKGSQGAAQYGIGLLVDAGGDDIHRSFTMSQGFGWVGGGGFLVDGAGADEYHCDIGDPDQGGFPLYYSPQMPQVGNTSFCQGAGFGNRSDSSILLSLSGGLGVLRDTAGDDRYEASLFAQGTGYWEGVGLLSDGAGADHYDAFWYVQGGVAHYAVGMCIDDGVGDDEYDQTRPSVSVNMGSGHDFSLGVLINEAGSETYYITGLSTGSSNCNALGLFVDNAGDDAYAAINTLNSGIGNHSAECAAGRPDAVSIGVMIDAGGTDSYTYPAMGPVGYVPPTNDSIWGYETSELPAEHGAGLDGTGSSGVHAGGSPL